MRTIWTDGDDGNNNRENRKSVSVDLLQEVKGN